MAGSIGVPPCRLVGAYYAFTPNHGTADLTITNLGRTVFSKTNAVNADGLQVPAAGTTVLEGEGKLVSGVVAVNATDVIAADTAEITLFFDLD